MKKKKGDGYSLIKQIATFFVLLFLAAVILSIIYFVYFTRTTYKNSIDYYQRIAEDNAEKISYSVISAKNQLDTIVADASNSPIWFTSSNYENMLYYQSMQNSLAGYLRISDIVDAIMILPRKSDLIIESHNMEEESFKRFLELYNRYNTVFPGSNYFDANNDLHLILSETITKRYYKTMLPQIVGTAYITIPFQGLLDSTSHDMQQVLVCRLGSGIKVCAWDVYDENLLSYDFSDIRFDSLSNIQKLAGYKVITTEIDDLDLQLLLFVPRSSLFSHMWKIVLVGAVLLLAFLWLTVFGIRFMGDNIHRPINSLIKDVHSISENGSEYRLKESKSYEISDISDSINQLLDELERRNDMIMETRENLRELHLLHRESQLIALQSQINPHFLYNTLECIRSLAQGYNADEISDILDPMIAIYRYSASSHHLGTIGTECECVRNYARIIGIRFDNRIRFEFDCDDSIENVQIPRMVLQPIVENAVNHGYANTLDDVFVLISTTRVDGDAVLSVKDCGCGMKEDELECLRERIYADKESGDGKHVGLRNVHQRIRREFGDKYGVRIESSEGKGTDVVIVVPLQKEAKP